MIQETDGTTYFEYKDTKTWQDIKVLNYPISIYTKNFHVSENGKFIIGHAYKNGNIQDTQELWSIEKDSFIQLNFPFNKGKNLSTYYLSR